MDSTLSKDLNRVHQRREGRTERTLQDGNGLTLNRGVSLQTSLPFLGLSLINLRRDLEKDAHEDAGY